MRRLRRSSHGTRSAVTPARHGAARRRRGGGSDGLRFGVDRDLLARRQHVDAGRDHRSCRAAGRRDHGLVAVGGGRPARAASAPSCSACRAPRPRCPALLAQRAGGSLITCGRAAAPAARVDRGPARATCRRPSRLDREGARDRIGAGRHFAHRRLPFAPRRPTSRPCTRRRCASRLAGARLRAPRTPRRARRPARCARPACRPRPPARLGLDAR